MIHVESLSKNFNHLCAVDRITLDIRKGEILGLLGPNGAGKTTTLRMLTGYLMPTSGTIRVKDFSIKEHAVAIKKMIGYLPESAPLYHNMLVYDYLDFISKLRGLNKEKKHRRIKYLAEICGLNTVMHSTISELSKGFKQRVGLAHAMMDDPEILVLDEPTSGLDPNQIVEIRDIIRQIGKEKTVILSTHILSEAEATCDRIVIINKGKIVADDRVSNIKQAAGKEHVIHITLLNADPGAVVARLRAIDGVRAVDTPDDAETGSPGVRYTCKSDADLREQIYRVVKETDWMLIELYQETKTLETLFRELTKEN